MALRIGITGNSGSGKSVVSKMIADMGIPLYDVDARCKDLIRNDLGLRGAIIDLFGVRAYLQNGDYNSKFMANIVFNDKQQKATLEHEVGKYMMKDYDLWLRECKKKSHVFVIVDCAYFYELEIEHMVDIMVGVTAPLAIRMERIMKRDNITAEQVNDRLKNQMDQDTKMSNCHFVLDAGGESIDAKALNTLLVQLSVFGAKYNNLESRYRNLLARGIAYGMGVGSTMSSGYEMPIDLGELSGWTSNHNVYAGKFKSADTEQVEIKKINETIQRFFEDNDIVNAI